MATVRGMVCLKMVVATVILAQLSQSKVNNANEKGKVAASNKEIEKTIEQKTVQTIKKLENQFKSTFMAFTSAQNKTAVGTRVSEKENLERALRSLYVREKRSKGDWGSCKPLCKKRCLPTCNFVCCIAPPYDVPMQTVTALEKQMAWTSTQKKSNIKKHPVQKKIASKTHAGKKNDKAHQYKKLGGVCHASCLKACLPFCDFKCCVAAKKKKKKS